MNTQDNNKTITIETANGPRCVDARDVVRFPDGILGFRKHTDFVFFDINECEPFRSMLSVAEDGPDFVVMEPMSVFEDYKPMEALFDNETLDLGTPVDLAILSIVTLSENPEDITVNLRAPLIINLATSTGKQVILNNEEYLTRYPLYETA